MKQNQNPTSMRSRRADLTFHEQTKQSESIRNGNQLEKKN